MAGLLRAAQVNISAVLAEEGQEEG